MLLKRTLLFATTGSFWWTLTHAHFLRPYRLLKRFDSWNALTMRWHRASSAGANMVAQVTVASSPLFGTVAVDAAELHLATAGYWAGLQLPAAIVTAMIQHALRSPCRQNGEGEAFLIDEVKDGRSPAGAEIAVADVQAPGECPYVAALEQDAVVAAIAAGFLGYPPTKCLTRLYWSPASAMSENDRRWAGQTIDYHYDIERQRTLYVYFYLTDADASGGAHVLIRGSHRDKSWRFKLASTRQPEQRLFRHYAREDVTIVEGKAGFGFVEDPACFHKALAPIANRRLMLQLRIS